MPFLLHDGALQSADRSQSLHSTKTFSWHVDKARSSATTSLSPVNCPYGECETMFEQDEYLKNHLATVRSLNL